jgi:hypothetical protein
MRHTLLFVLLFPLGLAAQQMVRIYIEPMAGAEPFVLNSTMTDDQGNAYQPTFLAFYISRPIIIHDGGQQTLAPNHYYLVRADQKAMLELGEMDVQDIEGVIFSVGVDQASNHLDPASYPQDHPLAYQNPSMHWGWAAGYRFVAYEGRSGNNLIYSYEIHSIGNELYKTVQLEVQAREEDGEWKIELEGDYARLLEGIDVSGGLYAHGNLGGASTIMDNFEQHVFRAKVLSSVDAPASAPGFSLYPNPSGLRSQLSLDLPESGTFALRVLDVAGRRILERNLAPGSRMETLETGNPGLYFVQLWQDGRPLRTERWVVTD